MTIKFESFFKFDNPEKIKVKFNMTSGRGGDRAWDNLQEDDGNYQRNDNKWYNMNAHRSETGQSNNNLEHYEYVLAFAQYYPYGHEFYIFGGLYKKTGIRSNDKYELELQDDYKEYRKRLIIKLEKPIGRNIYLLKFKTVCDNMNVVIYEIRPEGKLSVFPGYNNVRLTHKELQSIINDREMEWKNALSVVKGVYCITDTLTGKIYIGSAYGNTNGIWQRWSSYANIKNLTGGNKYFELLKKECESYIIDNFQYSILEIMDFKTDKNEIIRREEYWKKVFKSVEFGMNEARKNVDEYL